MMFWKYLGTVSAYTTFVDKKGKEHPISKMHGTWILMTGPFGWRRAKLVGDPGDSQIAMMTLASVEAWLRGGPLPQLENTKEPPHAAE